MKTKSNYKENVLSSNKELKNEVRSVGGALKIINLLGILKDKPEMLKALKEAQKPANYDTFVLTVRKSKKGLVSPFTVLQALNKSIK